MPLQEYKEVVGAVAGVVTVAQFFAPIFICKQIITQGNTKNVDPTPFIGGIGMALLFLRHGYLLDDPTMVPVNLFALGLNGIYFLLFLAYSDEKKTLVTTLFKIVLGALSLVFYTFADPSMDRILLVYGSLVTGVMFALIGAPLRDLKEIVKNKDTGSMPFPMILAGTVTMSLWLLYGLIIENTFVIIQNLVGLALSSTQLTLFAIYPSSAKSDKKKKKTK